MFNVFIPNTNISLWKLKLKTKSGTFLGLKELSVDFLILLGTNSRSGGIAAFDEYLILISFQRIIHFIVSRLNLILYSIHKEKERKHRSKDEENGKKHRTKEEEHEKRRKSKDDENGKRHRSKDEEHGKKHRSKEHHERKYRSVDEAASRGEEYHRSNTERPHRPPPSTGADHHFTDTPVPDHDPVMILLLVDVPIGHHPQMGLIILSNLEINPGLGMTLQTVTTPAVLRPQMGMITASLPPDLDLSLEMTLLAVNAPTVLHPQVGVITILFTPDPNLETTLLAATAPDVPHPQVGLARI